MKGTKTIAQLKILPLQTEQLIDTLEVSYPPRCIAKDETLEEHLRYAGAVDLVETLRLILNRSS